MGDIMSIAEESFTRVNSDVNGNPRYVIDFSECMPDAWISLGGSISSRYAATCKLMNKIGGRKFHNKQYGGGIVFQSYSLRETINSIERIKEGTK